MIPDLASRRLRSLLLLAALIHNPRSAHAADCTCGYSVSTNSSSSPLQFTETLETDFLHTHDLLFDTNRTWIPQAYNQTPAASNGPYGKAAQYSNVVVNPLASAYDWGGTGLDGGDPGLQLFVRSTLIDLPSSGDPPQQLVPMSEIVTDRSDILFGSFRVAMKTSAVNGTCAGFFFYLNASAEIDMEFLSRQNLLPNNPSAPGLVNLVVQSPASAEVGFVNPGSPDFFLSPLATSPQSAYTEYRFDWLPDRIDYYADGELLHTITSNIPQTPGRIHVNHWSNGNTGWSAGPPVQDAVLTLSYIKAYFNSSSGPAPACDAGAQLCAVPEVSAPPDPTGPNGNVTGRTTFLTPDAGLVSEANSSASPSSSGPAGASPTHSSASRVALFSPLVACAVWCALIWLS